MKIWGQIALVSISILFTAYQWLIHQVPFFTVDFVIFTIIAWIVGWQYDRARHFEKKARASEDSYKQLLDAMPETIFIYHDDKIVYANLSTLRMIGARSRDEVLSRSVYEFLDHEYEERLRERIKLIKKEKRPLTNIEYKLKRLDGSKFFIEASSLLIVFGGKESILTVGKDVTERREQTDRLLQKSEKLALLGQMAAGIAHEIRNPLTSIRGFIQLFKHNQLQEDYYDIVLTELDRINNIVGEFLVLAKPTAAAFTELDVKNLIKDVVTFFNTQSIMSNAQIFVEFDSELPKLMGEENQLKQVFLNLLKNAVEAMPNGGNIDVTVTVKEEGKISIQVCDQGVGIPVERIPTLGEPFYTTKEKGTGLGLMTCFKIIESHSGELKIQSEEGSGTTVEVTLPTITQPLLKPREMSYSAAE
ncbi:ATP-binding protein [Neobacillus niacini]|uniref:ATP-binding protein n=1 Tax=Neobacillus niacini TaxID=86668 RepID=UPI0021CB7ABC|nr:ATP-binding protein [Neobacillus niacini]MCM3764523.1 ATP-binding protein [Neobacillus niacini]